MKALARGTAPGVVGLVLLSTACADRSVGPQHDESSGAPTAQVMQSASSGDTTVTVFTLSPGRGETFVIGGRHAVHFPSYSVCDPATSSYGAAHWDEPCQPLTSDIQITAKSWFDAAGHPRVDFSPALRFVPTYNSQQWVILYLRDKEASRDPAYKILYCAPESSCIDESLEDRTLVTRRDPRSGILYRRIKHFSGYEVSSG